MATHQEEGVNFLYDLRETWRVFTYMLRDATLTVLAPAPFLVLLLLVLSLAGGLSPLQSLFLLALVATFFYCMVVGGAMTVRGLLTEENGPLLEAKDEYYGGPWVDRLAYIIGDALRLEQEHRPITEQDKHPVTHLFVVALLSLIKTWFGFFVSVFVLAIWLRGETYTSLVAFVEQYGPFLDSLISLKAFELLIGALPLLSDLTIKNQLFVACLVLVTGFLFRSGAKSLCAVADEIHRRVIRIAVEQNPIGSGEFLPLAGLVAVYLLLLNII